MTRCTSASRRRRAASAKFSSRWPDSSRRDAASTTFLAHKYLGRAESFDYTVKESYGELLALMPREIGSVRLSAPQGADRGRPAPVSVTLSDWKADLGRTVFRVEVYGPGGNLYAPYTRTVACDGGRAELTIPFALNDAAGEWLVRATEAVSGHSDEARVTVGGG